MRAKYPIWHVLPGEQGPGKHKLSGYSDDEFYDADTGLLLVPVTDKLELSFSDDDDRFPGGWLGPIASLQPIDTTHWDTGCGFNCEHTTEIKCEYHLTDAGWYLVMYLPDSAEVWVHEEDVPISNHPDYQGWGQSAHRRPPRESN